MAKTKQTNKGKKKSPPQAAGDEPVLFEGTFVFMKELQKIPALFRAYEAVVVGGHSMNNKQKWIKCFDLYHGMDTENDKVGSTTLGYCEKFCKGLEMFRPAF